MTFEKTTTLLATAALLVAGARAMAQDDTTHKAQAAPSEQEEISNVNGKVTGLEESYLETKSTVAGLAKIKISGYVQAQYKAALDYKDATDSTGKYKYNVGDFAGGAFPTLSAGMFQVRRGRLKIMYDNSVEQAAIQLDCTPSGVGIKEAWAGLKEPWLKTFGVRIGVMDRPFGFEPSYSSASRESPEESRWVQTLLPDDYDLGADFEILPGSGAPAILQYFNARYGLFTGNGIGNETDGYLDNIGRFGVSIPLTAANLSIDAGVSGYAGSVVCTDTIGAGAKLPLSSRGTEYVTKVNAAGNEAMAPWTGRYGKPIDRMYGAGDLELSYGGIPVLGGLALRGEYVQGRQPGSATSSKSSNATSVTATLPIYEREFQGYYAEWVQNVDPLNAQLILKYDVYDPNTDVAGSQVSKANGFSGADIKYSTWGFGCSYYWGANVKLTAYWDLPHNETTANLAPYNVAINDNVFTLRVQYKF